jgi:hypothetical protein
LCQNFSWLSATFISATACARTPFSKR